ncbi:hypothetical protein CKM354_000416800 [Cercospora kikuchii]|uniref:NAD(P)/FAD-dependent oxidoreductase n=1 Tax=Cercospora kikuchii TaxID=84275 RepID=A0A9P3FFV7_9PEZI|nr:uncharacterized protein CKM354_000416800 [Cercospora kikuchii]GIZ40845.1 hypothetical protein CKM354_000416800 [Cercospora kikuchii]
MAEELTTDYLIIGAGAMGMAFADTMLSDTNASMVIVDRYARPGGHWTTAYPFVRLHQPSSAYGVNSRNLGENKIDQVGLNKGLMELATADEVLAYYSIVMHQTFLPSGRVRYFPKHEYLGEGEWRSSITGKTFKVGKKTKIVDATYMKVKVPSMGPPAYKVADDVNFVTPNDLVKIDRPHGGYTVVGAGKTGIDACLWLLTQGIEPEKITWIMPRDSWYLPRSIFQPGPEFAESQAKNRAATGEAVMTATSPEDLFLRLEASGQLLRLDEKIWPTIGFPTFLRQGRVVRIEPDELVLENGSHKPVPNTLYIDCTADGLAKMEAVPVFRGNTITLQSVRFCQQVFSAAFISHVEATYEDDKFKNELCKVIPHPDETMDYIVINLQTFQNGLAWAVQEKTAEWLDRARLNWGAGQRKAMAGMDPAKAVEAKAAMSARIKGMCAKMEQLLDQLPEGHPARSKAQIPGV